MKPTKENILAAFDSFGTAHVPFEALQELLGKQAFDKAAVAQAVNELIREDTLWMSESHVLCRAEVRDLLSAQWEAAKHVYAWHQVCCTVYEPRMRSYASKSMVSACDAFIAKGGVAGTRIAAFNLKEPALTLSDGRSIPYASGQLLVEQKAAEMRSNCR